MSYRIELSAQAEQELNNLAARIADSAPLTAQRWLKRFRSTIRTLRNNPERCPYARENEEFPFEIRQLLFGGRKQYRAVYSIKDDTVRIVTICPPGQDDLDPNKFSDEPLAG